MISFDRKTVKNSTSFEGLGLHSGVPVTLTVHPGDAGILFRCDGETTQADPRNVTETVRCTKLGNVHTVEHLMSAFAGLEITDAVVELTAPEVPAMDGSSKLFVDRLLTTGLEKIGESTTDELFTRLFLQEENVKIAVGKGNGHWRFEYDSTPRWPGLMAYEVQITPELYCEEIAPARTFAHAEEVAKILELGLAKGLDKDSAVILGESGFESEARFHDEPARHKLLDLIGDLYLSGVPLRLLNVVGHRSGHRTNVKMASNLKQSLISKSR